MSALLPRSAIQMHAPLPSGHCAVSMSSKSCATTPGSVSWPSAVPSVATAKTRAESPESLWSHSTPSFTFDAATPDASTSAGSFTGIVTAAA